MHKDKLYFDLTDIAVEDREITTRSGETVRTPVVTGYASVFNSDSKLIRERVEDGTKRTFVERIAPGAFDRSLQEAAQGSRVIDALWEHDRKAHLGSTRGGKLQLESDERGLRITLDATRLTPAQLDTIRDGDAGMSFGMSNMRRVWSRRSDGLPEATVQDLSLHEVTFTTAPAYQATSAAVRSLDEFEAEEKSSQQAEEVQSNDGAAKLAAQLGARRRLIELRLRKPRAA